MDFKMMMMMMRSFFLSIREDPVGSSSYHLMSPCGSLPGDSSQRKRQLPQIPFKGSTSNKDESKHENNFGIIKRIIYLYTLQPHYNTVVCSRNLVITRLSYNTIE